MLNQYDWTAKWALYSPDAIAIKEYETSRSITYAQLNAQANTLAQHLTTNYALQKGDRIAVLAENSLEYIVLFAVAQKTGSILVPFNYRLAPAEIDYLITNAAPKLLLTETKFAPKLIDSEAAAKVPHRISLEEIKAMATTPAKATFPSAELQPNDPIFILYTSGTTGFPKGALYTHKMLFWNSINTAISLIINTESRTLNCMPPFHSGGWNVLTTPLLHHGGYSGLMKNFDPAAVLKAIEEEKLTIFLGVPTMLKMMSDLPEFETANLSSLKYIIVGGEPMPIPQIERYHQKGIPIRQGFGMTEVGPNLTSLHQRDAVRKMGSIGRPNFYVQVKIVDEAGEECPSNVPGELLLKSPVVTPGYWQNPTATAKAFVGEWFRSGDRVRQDEEGYLYVVDRIKNMFISGGENVYPAEIERVLLTHPCVNAVAVVGIPDAEWGESGRAFVVLSEAVIEGELNTFCRSKLAKFKIPKSFIFMDELPKNDTGKINRQALKKWMPNP
ncbi:MAG: long-chain fatty acid--CoA ligase [Bacteroidota bacterium]